MGNIYLLKPTIGNEYGFRFLDPEYPDKGKHDGHDIRLNYLAPIIAVDKGVVASIRAYGGFWNPEAPNGSLLLIHDTKLTTKDNKSAILISHYVHGRMYIPDTNDSVEKGEVIGFTGGLPGESLAGNTATTHLHFGIGLIEDKKLPQDKVSIDDTGHSSLEKKGISITQSENGPYVNPFLNNKDGLNSYLDQSKNIICWSDFSPTKMNVEKFFAKLTRLTDFINPGSAFITNTNLFDKSKVSPNNAKSAAPIKIDNSTNNSNKNKINLESKNSIINYDIGRIDIQLKALLDKNNPYFNGNKKPNKVVLFDKSIIDFKYSDTLFGVTSEIKNPYMSCSVDIDEGQFTFKTPFLVIDEYINKYMLPKGINKNYILSFGGLKGLTNMLYSFILPLIHVSFPKLIYGYNYLSEQHLQRIGFNSATIRNTRNILKNSGSKFTIMIKNILEHDIYPTDKEFNDVFKGIDSLKFNFIKRKYISILKSGRKNDFRSLKDMFIHFINAPNNNVPVCYLYNLGYEIASEPNKFSIRNEGVKDAVITSSSDKNMFTCMDVGIYKPGDSTPNSVGKLPPSLSTDTLTTPYRLSNSLSPNHKKPPTFSTPSYSSSSPSSSNFNLFSQDFKFDAPQAPKKQPQPTGGSASSGSSGGGSRGQAKVTGLDNISKEKDAKRPGLSKMIQDFFKAQAEGESAGTASGGGESGGGSSGGSGSSPLETAPGNARSGKEKGKQDFKNIIQNMSFFNKDANSKQKDDKKQKMPNFTSLIKSAPSQPTKLKGKEKPSNLPSFIGPPKLNFAQPQIPSAPSAGGTGGRVSYFGSSAPKSSSSQASKSESSKSKQKPKMPPMPSLQPSMPSKSQKPLANEASTASSIASSAPEGKGQKKGEDRVLTQALGSKNTEKAKAQFVPKIVDLPNNYAKNKVISDKGEGRIGSRMPGAGMMESALIKPMAVPDFERGKMKGKVRRKSEKLAPKIINRTIKEPDVKLTIRKPPKVDDVIEFARKLGNQQFIESMRMQ